MWDNNLAHWAKYLQDNVLRGLVTGLILAQPQLNPQMHEYPWWSVIILPNVGPVCCNIVTNTPIDIRQT